MTDLQTLAWHANQLGQAIDALARASGWLTRASNAAIALDEIGITSADFVARGIEAASARLGLEAEPVETPYASVLQFVRDAGPALVRLPNAGEPRYLALLKSEWNRAVILGCDLTTHRVPIELVRDALCAQLEAPYVDSVNRLLAEIGAPDLRRPSARRAILTEWLSETRLGEGWLLRLSPRTDFGAQVQHARLWHPLAQLIGAHTAQQLVRIIAWAFLGQSALQGQLHGAWLLAWLLLFLTAIPFQAWTTWTESKFAFGVGGLFKQRLLFGILQLDPEEIRAQGIGQFLGRVMDSEAVELLALSGGLSAALALIELIVAGTILLAGAGGAFSVFVLIVVVAVLAWLTWRYWRRGQDWLTTYRAMTNDLVEQMVGHRTRLAQQDPARWHTDQDQLLAHYLEQSEQLDALTIQLSALAPRGWELLAFLGIVSVFIFAPEARTPLAIGLGGIFLASQALSNLTTGMASLVGAALAWKQARPLFDAAARAEEQPSFALAQTFEVPETSKVSNQPLLVARDMTFRYASRLQPALRDCNLVIRHGERILLEGPSGSGKSTLAALLAGLHTPEAGLLLMWGFDRQTIGAAEWRRRVVIAPQFHENFVFTETLGFNLLMGRQWPPMLADLRETEAICRELGLNDLLVAMPSGMQQMVGESGWRLSHGEQSRLFIARALLQKSDLIILDESFAALDPENLQRALDCVLRRAKTVLVIAHP